MVIGAGLAGMAAAARLAKAGHPVELWEASSTLGGRWAPYPLAGTRVLVDDLPAVLGFPAPWRDLFRKSGRPMEAELARSGYQLVPAGPTVLTFADRTELTLPTDRGEQFAVMSRAYGAAVAGRWRDLLDRLDDVWQTLRPLGLERELDPGLLTPGVRHRLLHRRSVADLAGSLGHPQLSALVRSVAYRQGSSPERTPALGAVDLAVARTFGAWQLEPTKPGPALDTGRSSVLVEALAARLALRKVKIRLSTEATGILVRDGQVVAIRSADGEQPTPAVISTVTPWGLAQLHPPSSVRDRWHLNRLRPAPGPKITHSLRPEPVSSVSETVALSTDGVPVVSYLRPAGAASVHSVHDFAHPATGPGHGLASRGFGAWWRRPGISGGTAGLYTAGPFSPAGRNPSQQILSGALASYACHDRLGDAASDRQ